MSGGVFKQQGYCLVELNVVMVSEGFLSPCYAEIS